MAHAYTPGLRVSSDTVIRKHRQLPIPGEILVSNGDQVTATTEVARTALPGAVYPVNVVNKLSIPPGDIRAYMRKQEGDWIEKGGILAENTPLIKWKWFKTQVQAPISGTIESISQITGQVFLRQPPEVIRLAAYVDGTIAQVVPHQAVVVESHCAFVQGIFGLGGETAGIISQAVLSPQEELTARHLTPEHTDGIVIGGALAQKETFLRAQELGIRALVVGGVHDRDLRELLGYDLGVAITGTEQIGFTLIVTEGFGRIPMAKRTFDLLTAKAGQQASCSGATQIRAGVIRPEVIIPLPDEGAESQRSKVKGQRSKIEEGQAGIQVGDIIRIIREPHFGVLARVTALPAELQRTATESQVRVLVASLPNGQEATIPRANVEMIEE